jgi:hypothetical protein
MGRPGNSVGWDEKAVSDQLSATDMNSMDFNEALKCANAKLWPPWRSQAKLGNEKKVFNSLPLDGGGLGWG